MTTIRAIFFDAVGTLLHPDPPAPLVYADAGKLFGSHYSLETIAQRFAAAFQNQEAIDRRNGWITTEQRELTRWRDIVGEVLDDVADPTLCFEFLYHHFERPEAWRCEPGVAGLCKKLRERGYQLGMASNFDARLFALIRGIAPLHDFVASDGVCPPVIVSSQVGFRKPAPEFFQIMCRQTGLEAAEVLHVGDDPDNDYAGAKEAGMQAMLFDPRGRYTDCEGKRIRDLGELLNL